MTDTQAKTRFYVGLTYQVRRADGTTGGAYPYQVTVVSRDEEAALTDAREGLFRQLLGVEIVRHRDDLIVISSNTRPVK